MKLSTLLITIFLTGMFISGFTGMIGGLLNSRNLDSPYDLPANANFSRSNSTSSTLTSLARMYNVSEAAQNETIEADIYSDNPMLSFITGAMNAVMGLFEIPAFFGGLIADLTGMPNMPVWFASGLYAIGSVVVIFSIYYFFTGRDS